MFRIATVLLLVATSAFAAGPFVGDEERIASLRNPSDLVLAASANATLLAWNEGGRIRARAGDTTRDLGNGLGISVASDGNDFTIVWQEDQRIVGVGGAIRRTCGRISPRRRACRSSCGTARNSASSEKTSTRSRRCRACC